MNNYNLTLVTAPVVEPISLQEAKDFLNWDDSTDTSSDDYITSLIKVAREYCENFQNRAYITQTWDLSIDYWPCSMLELPKGNLQSIVSVKYKDYAGAETTLAATEYVYSTKGIKGRLTPAYGKTWPSFTPYPLDAVTIRFTCGYGAAAANVPAVVKQAMQLLICHWFENRAPLTELQTSKELDFAVTALLWQNRILII